MSVVTTLKTFYKSSSFRSIGIYTFSNFFAKGASFLLLFVFTNPLYISPSENGLLSLFSNTMLFLMPFLGLGIVHSTSADFYKLNKDQFRNFFTTGFIMPLAVMLISMIVLFFLRNFLSANYGFPLQFFWLIPVVTFLIFCNEQLLSITRNNNEPGVYMKVNIWKTVIELGLSFVLVVYFAARYHGRVAGIFSAYLLMGIFALYYFKKKGYLFGKIERKYISSELIYAVPIIALQGSIFAMNASDKFFLSDLTNDNNETVGIYSIACVFASVVNVLSMALIQYIFPRIFTILSASEIDYKAIRKLFVSYFGVMLVGLAGLILLTPFLYHQFIHPKYYPALEYSFLLCIGYFLWAISYFFYSFLLYYKLKKKLLLLSLCCITVSLLCHYFFIKEWKEFGGALSVCISYFVVFLITLAFTSKYWRKLFTTKA